MVLSMRSPTRWSASIILGFLAIGLSGWNMALFTLEVDPWTVAWNVILQGIGSAIMWVPLSIVAFATLPVTLLPDASSIFHLLRNFGSSIFISVSVLTVSRTGKISYSELSEHITAFADVLRFQQVMGRWSFDTAEGLVALGSEVSRQARPIVSHRSGFKHPRAAGRRP